MVSVSSFIIIELLSILNTNFLLSVAKLNWWTKEFLNSLKIVISASFKIEKYFNQDDSDMVVISRPYLPRLFFIKEELYNAIKREQIL